MEEHPKYRYDQVTALQKARNFCAYRERCQQEIRNKLYEWGLYPREVEQVIGQLISENFLNEERFAKAFSTGKFRIKGWGRNKIKLMLRQLNVSDYCIKKGLAEINDTEYEDVLKRIIEKKSHSIKEKNDFKRKNKIAAYAMGKGFEGDLIWDLIKELK